MGRFGVALLLAGGFWISHGALAGPPMAVTVRGLPELRFEECLERERTVLRAGGYGDLRAFGNGEFGSRADDSASIACVHGRDILPGAGPGGTVIVVTVAGGGDIVAVRNRLLEAMLRAPGTASPPGPPPIAPPPSPRPPPVAAAECKDFAGTWDLGRFGFTTIVVNDQRQVTGFYTNNQGRLNGSVAVGIGELVLTTAWEERGASGRMLAKLSGDGKSLSCEWNDTAGNTGRCDGPCASDLTIDFEKTRSPPASGFAGTWSSGFGTIRLSVSGDQASGTYEWKGGRLSGTVRGDVLEGRWVQNDRPGLFRFQLSADGKSFAGTWTEADGSGGGTWNGTRQ